MNRKRGKRLPKPLSFKELIRHRVATRKLRLPDVSGIRPNPCELDWIVYDPELVEEYRLLRCPCYGECLDVARVGKWRNFTCRACDVFGLYADSSRYTKKVKRGI
jgi:hypothetical protein